MIDQIQERVRIGVEGCLRLAPLLELQDVARVARVHLPQELRGRDRGARKVGRVESDHSGRPMRMHARERPHEQAAPIVTGEHRPLVTKTLDGV